MTSEARESFSRWPALLVSLAVVVATLWPMFRDPPRDSFPLSNYPMFSTVRGKPWIHVVVGFDAEGAEYAIPPKKIASAEVMAAAQTVRKAVRRGGATRLCKRVAERVADDPDFAHIELLEVQSRQFDPRTYFVDEDGRVPLKLRRRAKCRLRRSP